jgi:hypothetical protein
MGRSERVETRHSVFPLIAFEITVPKEGWGVESQTDMHLDVCPK